MKRVKELEELILKHKAAYYAGNPLINDFEYDKLEEELKNLAPNSFALEVVGSGVTGKKVKHDQKMLSLAKVYTQEEIEKWQAGHAVVSLFKIDGMSCSLIYEKGELILAKTRGDGSFGEDITQKVQWINVIPKTLGDFSGEIRGEIYCTEEDFFQLAKEMEKIGLEVPSSQRNIVAGIIGRKDHISLARFLVFTPFDLIDDKTYKFEHEKLDHLEQFGFKTIPYSICKTSEDIKHEIERCAEFMAQGNFLIDGQVFIIDDIGLHEQMGFTAHHPKFKMAFKFRGETAIAEIAKIEWSVSRNGILTPVANIVPVELSGAKISRVTLHNYGLVKQFQIKVGDKIEIVRSGEVIPKFLGINERGDGIFEIPTVCPSCQTPVVEEGIRLFCKNSECPAQKLEEILNFVQKIGMNDISSKRLAQMLDAKIISSIEDLYTLTIEKLLSLDKTQEKLANKILAEIENSRKADLITFLSALGIPGGAYNRCEKVVNAGYNTIESILNLTVEQLCEVEGFAEKSAQDFVTGIQKRNKLIQNLINCGFSLHSIEKTDMLCFCITGALSRKRSLIEADIRARGYKVVSSVTKETTHLVCNQPSSSSKYKKALNFGIPIITEEELTILLEG